jgi:DNA-binding transcriptional regulator PaaX
MALEKAEIRLLFDRLIFDETDPQDWVEDVWGLSPMMGDSALKLLEVFHKVLDRTPESELQEVLKEIYVAQMNDASAKNA